MRKTISLLALTAIIATLFFSGCKKGENDPFLSLKSRNARLAQTWELSSEDYTTVSKSGSITTSGHSTYDGSSETTVTTTTSGSYSNTSTDTKTYSEEITFDKDGTYELTVNDDGDIYIEKGNWMWIDKNKGQDIKNKEAIIMVPTEDPNETYSGKTNSPDMILVFDELSSKELVVLYDYSEQNTNGDSTTKTGTITYSKK